jgi:hypothetical protein
LPKLSLIPIPSERDEQRWLVNWLNLHPVLRDFYCKLDNEGKRTPRQGYHLKLAGLRPGVSDLFIYYPTSSYCGLWLEVKQNRKYMRSERLTKTWVAQENFARIVKSVGYSAKTCYGWFDGKRIVEEYLLT